MFFAVSHVPFLMTIRLVLFNLCELASICYFCNAV